MGYGQSSSSSNGGYPGQLNASNSAVKRNLTRAKTLTRPDRHITPAPLINPHKAPGAAAASGGVLSSSKEKPSWWQPWTFYINTVTFWAPGALLSACGMREKPKQRAWKEKVALCSIAIVMGAFVGFATIGLNRTLCPDDQGSTPNEFIRLGEQTGKHCFLNISYTSPLYNIALQASWGYAAGCSTPPAPTMP